MGTGALIFHVPSSQSKNSKALQLNQGAIHAITATSRGDYAAVTERGLVFFDFDKTSSEPIRQLGEQLEFGAKKLTLVCECSEEIFVVATIDRPNLLKVNRDTGSVKLIEDKSQNSSEHGYTDL